MSGGEGVRRDYVWAGVLPLPWGAAYITIRVKGQMGQDLRLTRRVVGGAGLVI